MPRPRSVIAPSSSAIERSSSSGCAQRWPRPFEEQELVEMLDTRIK